MSVLRRLSQAGIERFVNYLAQLDTEPMLPPPLEILSAPEFSRALQPEISLTPQIFSTRWEAASYLSEILNEVSDLDVLNDEQLWTWLSLYFFDSVCPADGNGRRTARNVARYVLQATDYQRYYRHLLAMPYRILRSHRDHPDRALALLCGAVSVPGELAEQVSAYQELVSNPSFVELVTALYFDQAKRQLKRGAGGSGLGSPRRLVAVSRQLDVTYDFYSLTATQIAQLLPKEFDRPRLSGPQTKS